MDWPLQSASLIIAIAGLALIYSTSVGTDNSSVFTKQLTYFCVSILFYLFFCFFDYHSLTKANRIGYVVFIFLLYLILIIGPEIRGGRRWLPLGFANVQLAEFVKISVILGLSRILYLNRGAINSGKILLWSFLYAAIPAILVLKEPDLGSALIIMSIWGGILLISPIKKIIVVYIVLSLIVVSGLSWKFFLKDFQKDRIMVFIYPELDPKGKGYNVRQATIAVGSGKLFGTGLGKGEQGQNKFLPERQTDFIFAASSEEVGFLGSSSIVLLYAFIFFRIVKIMQKSRDDLGMYISGAIFFFLFFHTLINIGMNIGILPVTGIPLPLISAGGSSLIVTISALGILQNIAIQSKILRF